MPLSIVAEDVNKDSRMDLLNLRNYGYGFDGNGRVIFQENFLEREKRFSYDRISNELFYRNIPSFLKRES